MTQSIWAFAFFVLNTDKFAYSFTFIDNDVCFLFVVTGIFHAFWAFIKQIRNGRETKRTVQIAIWDLDHENWSLCSV